ncbi:MAG: GNAT family N-acetyltransferase [Actinocatenispora sp.]
MSIQNVNVTGELTDSSGASDALLIAPSPYDGPVARRLVRAVLADLGGRYGGAGDETPVDPTEFVPPAGSFLVAWRDGTPVGCGGWRSHGAGIAELKRMYTAPEARGTGVARAMLTAIERDARAAGRARVILECGARQPEALRLYERCGYTRIENYGFYAGSADCRSYGRDLD